MSTEDRLKKIVEESFIEGYEAIADETSAGRTVDRAEAIVKAGEAANRALDLADQLAADGNPVKKQVAETIQKAILGGVRRVANQPQGEGRAAIEADPFSGNSSELETSSPDLTKALPQPTPKKRGRPPKQRS